MPIVTEILYDLYFSIYIYIRYCNKLIKQWIFSVMFYKINTSRQTETSQGSCHLQVKCHATARVRNMLLSFGGKAYHNMDECWSQWWGKNRDAGKLSCRVCWVRQWLKLRAIRIRSKIKHNSTSWEIDIVQLVYGRRTSNYNMAYSNFIKHIKCIVMVHGVLVGASF